MSPPGPYLAAQRVVFTGRLASMSRMEAIQLIHRRGGTVRSRVSRRTQLLVIGADGLPLQKSGAIAANLRRARQLQVHGLRLNIVGEADFVRHVLGEERFPCIHRQLTLEQLSRLLGISGLRIRRWIELGLVRPSNPAAPCPLFDFSEVNTARTIAKLIDNGVRPGRLAASLRALRRFLPQEVRVHDHLLAVEKQLLVCAAENQVIGHTGQLYFRFEEPLAVAEVPPTRRPVPNSSSADDHFDRAFRSAADGLIAEAIADYRRWLVTYGQDAEVHFNLANAYYELGQYAAALRSYRRSVKLAPDYQAAWNNLGLCRYQLGHVGLAIRALRRAVQLGPDDLQSLFNLADVLEEVENVAESRLLWLRLARQPIDSDITRYAQRRVAQLDQPV